jgi:signal transduction histidine kinase
MAEQPHDGAHWDSADHGGSSRTTAFLHNAGHWHSRLQGDDGGNGAGPLRRSRDDRLLGGVAAGLARRTGFSVGVWRVLFVTATIVTSGYLAIAYVLAWLFIPAEGASKNIASRAVTDRRGIGLALALTSVLVVALIIVSALHAPWVTSLAIPLLVCAAGVLLIARNAGDDEQQYLRGLAEPAGLTATSRRSRRLLRIVVAIALGIAGLAVLLRGQDKLEALKSVAGIVFLVGGIALAFGPWWLRLARDAVEERQARVRAEERAEMASRVHDSVLQTLALIQRRAGDQQQVIQLARAQERELRSWLFDGRTPGSLDGQAETVADGIRLIQQEVEAQHGMSVEAVTVGDCPLDDDMNALLAAAREATVNAAKWSGADVVSLFAEVEPESVSLFVRDRGKGFDPDAVPDDRKGVAESIKARLARRGGSATVRSAPGQGTEVSLVMPRLAEDRLSRRA